MGTGDDTPRKRKRRLRTAARDVLAHAGQGFKSARRFIGKSDPRLRRYLGANSVVVVTGIVFLVVDPKQGTLGNIGASLVAAGVTGFVFLLHQSLTYQDEQKAKRLHEVGLESVYLDRSNEVRDDFGERLANARRSIDILGFGLQNFREDFDGVRDWWSGRPNVRILVLDPDFPGNGHSYAEQRDKEEHQQESKIAQNVADFVRYLREGLGEITPAADAALARWEDGPRDTDLQLKLAQCIPAITVFRIDDTIFWGPYLIERVSRRCPTFAVQSGRPLFEAIERHFNSIWNDWSTDAPAGWLQVPPKP